LTADDWKALKQGDDSRFGEKERAAFSEPEIVDLHLLTGLVNLTNRLTDPLGLEVEFPEEKI